MKNTESRLSEEDTKLESIREKNIIFKMGTRINTVRKRKSARVSIREIECNSAYHGCQRYISFGLLFYLQFDGPGRFYRICQCWIIFRCIRCVPSAKCEKAAANTHTHKKTQEKYYTQQTVNCIAFHMCIMHFLAKSAD